MTNTADFEAFALARAPQLYRSAWLLCGNRHTAEDLVQEALAKVYVAWQRPLGRGPIENPAGYAHTTLVRTFISSRRRRSAWERPTEVIPDRMAGEVDPTLRLTLVAALGELPPLDRAVLVLRFFDDQPVERVADLLDLSSGAVRNRTMRALARIREVLGSELEELTQGGTP